MKQRLKRIAGRVSTWLKSSITDFMMLVGVAALVYGIYQVYVPAAYAVTGLLLIGWAVLIEWNRAKK